MTDRFQAKNGGDHANGYNITLKDGKQLFINGPNPLPIDRLDRSPRAFGAPICRANTKDRRTENKSRGQISCPASKL